MHEEPSDERAHSLTYRFFPSAMLLDEIGSSGIALLLVASMREFFRDFIYVAITSL
jgi:hypothetical protein